MPILASTILDRASKILQDTTNVRWPTSELIQWFNDGQREIVLNRPDSNVRNAIVTLAAGTRQAITTGIGSGGVGASIVPAKLLDVVCTVTGTARNRAVRLIQREVLDAQTPAWHGATGVADVVHYMVDVRDPLSFYVYPPALVTSKVEVVFSAYPTDITDPVSSSVFSLADIYGNAELDYILYRAYSKDSDYAGNAQRAQFHYSNFANSLGIDLKSYIAMAPGTTNSIWNPNTPGGGGNKSAG